MLPSMALFGSHQKLGEMVSWNISRHRFPDLPWEGDCPEDPRAAQATLAEDVGYLLLLPCICVVGVALNIVNLIVFTRPGMNNVVFTFLAALAAADLTTLLVVLPVGASRCTACRPPGTPPPHAALLYEAFVYIPLANMSGTASVWVTTSLTLERYVFVRKHRIARQMTNHLRARVTVLVVVVLAFLLTSPYFFGSTVSDKGQVVESEFGSSDAFQVYSWVRVSLAKFAPAAAVLVINCLLVLALRRAERRRRSMVFQNSNDVKRQRLQNRMTMMLLGVSFGFLLAHVPESLMHRGIVTSIFGPCVLHSFGYKVARLVTNCLEMLSYSYHFFLYVFFNQQFRDNLRYTCCVRSRVQVVPEKLSPFTSLRPEVPDLSTRKTPADRPGPTF